MIKIKAGQRHTKLVDVGKKRGQITIESTVAFVAFVILILGTFNILLWFGRNFRDRYIAYQSGRIFSQETIKNEKRDDEAIKRGIRVARIYPWSEGFYKASRLYVFDRENPRLYRDISCPRCKDSRSTSEVELRMERK